MIDLAVLLEDKRKLEAEQEQTLARLNAVGGALQYVEDLIARAESVDKEDDDEPINKPKDE